MNLQAVHCFNLEMLATRVWRLIDETESLCARVLRAKYYPSGDNMIADPRKGTAFTWQSIVAGIQTFKRSCLEDW